MAAPTELAARGEALIASLRRYADATLSSRTASGPFLTAAASASLAVALAAFIRYARRRLRGTDWRALIVQLLRDGMSMGRLLLPG